MKKEIKKLRLGKKTISNLQPSDMGKIVGCGHGGGGGYHTRGECTKDGGNTCPGHNTCNNC